MIMLTMIIGYVFIGMVLAISVFLSFGFALNIYDTYNRNSNFNIKRKALVDYAISLRNQAYLFQDSDKKFIEALVKSIIEEDSTTAQAGWIRDFYLNGVNEK